MYDSTHRMFFPRLSCAQIYSIEQLDTMQVFHSIEKALEAPELVIRLDLTRKRLKSFPEEILQFSNLQELVLNRNKLDSIPKSITQLKHLNILRANRNEIDSFPDYLCKLNKLVILDLSNNYIKSIPDDVYKLKNLEEFIMWSNLIAIFPQSLSRLEKLRVLTCCTMKCLFLTRKTQVFASRCRADSLCAL